MTRTILVVEDDAAQRLATKNVLTKCGYKTIEAGSGEEALYLLNSNKIDDIDLVLLDLFMPEMDGREVLKKIHQLYPTIPVIILTISSEIDDAVDLIRLGASDFINKPVSPSRLKLSIEQHLKIRNLSIELSKLRRKEEGRGSFDDLIGIDGGLAGCIAFARKAANSDIPVLITGESGVGKELLARAIHGEGHRTGKAFVAINCGAIPENLVESILFGHEKGSFTGAIAKEIGKFREAEAGTLFLDEVAELKPDMQTKLLRVLQQKEIQPVGSGKPIKINVRIISATNRNLAEDVANGKFRDDLYYRLNVMPIRIPSLKDRKQDIPKLVNHILEKFCALENKFPVSISKTAMNWLTERNWNGNIRELENFLYRAIVLSEKTELSDIELISMTDNEVATKETTKKSYYIDLTNESGVPKKMEEIESEVINATLSYTCNNVSETAKILGMGQSTIYKKLQSNNAA
ncbi:MAG: sigma-54 dependent transcriptional regulator [Pseudomonadota bacterium]